MLKPRRAPARPAGPPGSAAAAGSARKRLRVYLRSEHQHQQNAADAAEPPSWVLSISGRLLGKDKAADKAAAVAEAAGEGRRWQWRQQRQQQQLQQQWPVRCLH